MSAPSPALPSTLALVRSLRLVYEEDGLELDVLLAELAAALGATRTLVVRGDPRSSGCVVGAHARDGNVDARAVEDVSRSVLCRAFAENRVVAAGLATDDGTRSMLELEIHAAIAAPLRVGSGSPAGALYLELESSPGRLETLRKELMTTAAALVSAALERMQRDSGPPPAKSRGARTEPALPSLDELLEGPSFAPIAFDIRAACHTELPVLLLGESGTGKTLLARAMAHASQRTPAVRVMLGSSDDVNTVASELFGHERGAFSGATARRVGLAEQADGGTLVLDEILNLPMHVQQLLLDFVQFGLFRPLGYAGREPRHADARIIAATNGDPDEAVRAGTLRFDLYQRLGGVVIRLLPLREHRHAIVPLATRALAQAGGEWTLSRSARRALAGADLLWPGNVRELELTVSRARGRALAESPDARVVEPWHLGLAPPPRGRAEPVRSEPEAEPSSPRERWARLHNERARIDADERAILEEVMRRHHGVIARAAKELGIPRTTLIGRLRGANLAGKASPTDLRRVADGR